MLLPGFGSATAARAEADSAQARSEARLRDQDPHLRRCKAVVGYHIEAGDGEIGHVQGMLVDEDSWAIRYLVVSTGNWWLGHDVLVAPQWIQRVSWAERTVAVDLTCEALKQAPWYDPALPLSREMEIAVSVYKHYGRAAYWPDAEAAPDRAALPSAAQVPPEEPREARRTAPPDVSAPIPSRNCRLMSSASSRKTASWASGPDRRRC